MLSEPSESFISTRHLGILFGMKMILRLLRHLCGCLGVLFQLLRYVRTFCWALLLPRTVVAAQLLAFQSQLVAEMNSSCGRKKRRCTAPGLLDTILAYQAASCKARNDSLAWAGLRLSVGIRR